MTMYRKIFVFVAAVVLSATSMSARNSDFTRYNRWMVGADVMKSATCTFGAGVDAIYGRQFSEIIFLGVGFGADVLIGPRKTVTVTEEFNDGTKFETITLPQRTFVFPLYADLQVDFSRGRAPVFAEFKLGAGVGFDYKRIRGTEQYNKMEPCLAGPLFGVGIGKRFAFDNDDELSLILGVQGILGPFYPEIPVSLGVRYGF